MNCLEGDTKETRWKPALIIPEFLRWCEIDMVHPQYGCLVFVPDIAPPPKKRRGRFPPKKNMKEAGFPVQAVRGPCLKIPLSNTVFQGNKHSLAQRTCKYKVITFWDLYQKWESKRGKPQGQIRSIRFEPLRKRTPANFWGGPCGSCGRAPRRSVSTLAMLT